MKSYQKFLVLIVVYGIVSFLLKRYLYLDELLYNFYSEQLAQKQIEQLLENQQKWSWVGYAVMPLLILVRSSLVAFCLSFGLFFYETENKIKFKQLFRVALLGEFVLVLVGYVKFGYFYFIKTELQSLFYA